MRGAFEDQGRLFSYISPEQRVPARHPLRTIRELVREVLGELDPDFRTLYATTGRPSIPPEQLVSALLLHVLYGVRSERQLMEQLDYNLLYRWFVGLSPDDAVWDATTLTKNRERLQHGDIFNRFMEKLLHHQEVTPLLSDEHFSDGTLIDAWAGHKSFKPKDDKDGDGAHFHGTPRHAGQHDRSRQPSLPQERRQGKHTLLYGPRHNGKPERSRCRGAGHAGQRHGGTCGLGGDAGEESLAPCPHHGRRGQGL
jgi:transposase